MINERTLQKEELKTREISDKQTEPQKKPKTKMPRRNSTAMAQNLKIEVKRLSTQIAEYISIRPLKGKRHRTHLQWLEEAFEGLNQSRKAARSRLQAIQERRTLLQNRKMNAHTMRQRSWRRKWFYKNGELSWKKKNQSGRQKLGSKQR